MLKNLKTWKIDNLPLSLSLSLSPLLCALIAYSTIFSSSSFPFDQPLLLPSTAKAFPVITFMSPSLLDNHHWGLIIASFATMLDHNEMPQPLYLRLLCNFWLLLLHLLCPFCPDRLSLCSFPPLYIYGEVKPMVGPNHWNH